MITVEKLMQLLERHISLYHNGKKDELVIGIPLAKNNMRNDNFMVIPIGSIGTENPYDEKNASQRSLYIMPNCNLKEMIEEYINHYSAPANDE